MNRCIPYRLIKADEIEEDSSVDFVNKLEVLMVSSPNRHDLVFPKVYFLLKSLCFTLICNCSVFTTHLYAVYIILPGRVGR